MASGLNSTMCRGRGCWGSSPLHYPSYVLVMGGIHVLGLHHMKKDDVDGRA
jgi:hypothetical protein